MALAFALINGAAAVRTLAAAALPSWYPQTILVAGALWLAAFAIFVAEYAGVLVRARADGRGEIGCEVCWVARLLGLSIAPNNQQLASQYGLPAAARTPS